MYITFCNDLLFTYRYSHFLHLNKIYWATTFNMFHDPNEHLQISTSPDCYHPRNIFLIARGLTTQMLDLSARINDLKPNTNKPQKVVVSFNVTTHADCYVVKPVDDSYHVVRCENIFESLLTISGDGDCSMNRADFQRLFFQLTLRKFQTIKTVTGHFYSLNHTL